MRESERERERERENEWKGDINNETMEGHIYVKWEFISLRERCSNFYWNLQVRYGSIQNCARRINLYILEIFHGFSFRIRRSWLFWNLMIISTMSEHLFYNMYINTIVCKMHFISRILIASCYFLSRFLVTLWKIIITSCSVV